MSVKGALVTVSAAVLCLAASYALATNGAPLVAGALLILGALALGLVKWRWSIHALLIFMPFSGIPITFTYPRTQLAVLLKDILFVIPAYAGFMIARRRQGLSFPGAPLLPLVGFGALVVVQSILPRISNPLVPLVGMKVWLLYIPLLFLGYYLNETRPQLVRLLGLMSWVGLPPLAIGVVEAVMMDSGRGDLVYSWYGAAAQGATQNFADAGYPGAHLMRVPSTFSFVAQYYVFTSAMVVVTFGWWRLSGKRWGIVLLGLALVASGTSGANAAFIMTPLLVALMVLLNRSYRQGAAAASTLVVGVATATVLIGLSAGDALLHSVYVGSSEFQDGFVAGIPNALRLTLVGFGTGTATGSSRYVDAGFSGPLPSSESWWVKVILELGVAGLMALLLVLCWLVLRAYRGRPRLTEPGVRAVWSGFFALLLWTLVYSTKGPQIDLDPLNVYFWLFAGLLLSLPALQPEGSQVEAALSRSTAGIAPNDGQLRPGRAASSLPTTAAQVQTETTT